MSNLTKNYIINQHYIAPGPWDKLDLLSSEKIIDVNIGETVTKINDGSEKKINISYNCNIVTLIDTKKYPNEVNKVTVFFYTVSWYAHQVKIPIEEPSYCLGFNKDIEYNFSFLKKIKMGCQIINSNDNTADYVNYDYFLFLVSPKNQEVLKLSPLSRFNLIEE